MFSAVYWSELNLLQMEAFGDDGIARGVFRDPGEAPGWLGIESQDADKLGLTA